MGSFPTQTVANARLVNVLDRRTCTKMMVLQRRGAVVVDLRQDQDGFSINQNYSDKSILRRSVATCCERTWYNVCREI